MPRPRPPASPIHIPVHRPRRAAALAPSLAPVLAPILPAILVAGLAASHPAAAASPIAEIICAPRAEMEARLAGAYGARLAGSGIRDVESVMQLWTTEATGEWTLVLAYASGQSCIVGLGEAWEPPLSEDPA